MNSTHPQTPSLNPCRSASTGLYKWLWIRYVSVRRVGISVPAQTPARGKICRRFRVRSWGKVQAPAASALALHPWFQEKKMTLNYIKERCRAFIRSPSIYKVAKWSEGHLISKGVLAVWEDAEQPGLLLRNKKRDLWSEQRWNISESPNCQRETKR